MKNCFNFVFILSVCATIFTFFQEKKNTFNFYSDSLCVICYYFRFVSWWKNRVFRLFLLFRHSCEWLENIFHTFFLFSMALVNNNLSPQKKIWKFIRLEFAHFMPVITISLANHLIRWEKKMFFMTQKKYVMNYDGNFNMRLRDLGWNIVKTDNNKKGSSATWDIQTDSCVIWSGIPTMKPHETRYESFENIR